MGEEFYSLYQLLQPIGPIRVEICTDVNFSTALNICNTLMVHTGKIFSTPPQVEETQPGHLSSPRQQQFLTSMPEDITFTRQIYLQIAETLGIPVPSADRYINRWVSSGMIEKVGHGEFRRGIKRVST